jgi:altered-inheritance-of-mitochondria protein 5
MQALQLRSQTTLLNNMIDERDLAREGKPITRPAPLPIREDRIGVVERAKDRWNEEITGAVRWMQNVKWDVVRDCMENGVTRAWGKLKERENGKS